MLRISSILICLIICSVLYAGYQKTPENGFILKGYIEGLPKETVVFLLSRQNDVSKDKDTFMAARAVNGKFTFSGKINGAHFYFLSIDSRISKANTTVSNALWLENKHMNLRGTVSRMDSLTLEGSLSQKDYQSSVETINNYNRTNDRSVVINYLNDHKNSMIMPYLLGRLRPFFTLDSLIYYFNASSKEAQSTPTGIKFKKELDLKYQYKDFYEKGPIGNVIPNFQVMTSTGDKVFIHDMISKKNVTLIDFWASWCVPCRALNPQLSKVYNKYNSKGFQIIGISIDAVDSDWLKAVKEDNMAWIQTSDKIDNSYKYIFGMWAVPAYLLVDKNARVIKGNPTEINTSLKPDEVVNIEKLDSLVEGALNY
ncbi:TlpA disulfide reductase family protein [Chitinophaga rhizosphaerae]|uniref:TlpA disulfide reductase family protein n=1 Tax=Chitinophaga rhizosphaerae TaxID=1864947 RepID=UPI000F8019D1|nr:TlpA disulfide reductase family protein [Chitinophaga rhizosphaerae]